MRKINPTLRKIISTDPYFKKCARSDEGDCDGRITIDHALIYAGRQIDELWNFVPTCAKHHDVDQFQDQGNYNKEKQVWLALMRATDEELSRYSKAINYFAMRKTLQEKYGTR